MAARKVTVVSKGLTETKKGQDGWTTETKEQDGWKTMSETKSEENYVKVFVGKIPKHINEDEVRATFSKFGNVIDTFLMKDLKMGGSRGCAFVKYGSRPDADTAIAKAHGAFLFPGQMEPCEARYADGEENRLENKLFVGKLPPTSTEADLEELFGEYGEVKRVRVMVWPETGKSKGSAFVFMDSRASGEAAIRALQGKVTLDSGLGPLKVDWAESKSQKNKRKADDPRHGGGRGGAAGTYTSFVPRESEIPLGGGGGGMGFHAYNGLGGGLPGGMAGGPPLGMPWQAGGGLGGGGGGGGGPEGVKLYVSGLPEDMEKGKVWEVFSRFGLVAEVYVMNREKNPGCAFVKYLRPQEADAAITALHDRTLEGGRMPLRVKYAQSRGPGGGGPGGPGGPGGGLPPPLGGLGALGGPPPAAAAAGLMGHPPGLRGSASAVTGVPKLFVGGLPPHCGERDVAAVFQQYVGPVNEVFMKRKDDGSHAGFAFVHFGSRELAALAIQTFNGRYVMPGGTRPIEVAVAQGEAELGGAAAAGVSAAAVGAAGGGMLGGGGLGLGLGMGGMGGLGGMGGMGMGAGSGALGAGALGGFGGGSDRDSAPAPKLYVAGLPLHLSQQDVKGWAQSAGHCESVYLMMNEGKSKGVAFVRFQYKRESDTFLRQFDGYHMPGADRPLIVRYADNQGPPLQDSSSKRAKLEGV